ncbi:hypothetical protein [Acidiphilium sp. 37-64-53]|nr:hypothetical protein [Acidiphilium sp. 37-64-53]
MKAFRGFESHPIRHFHVRAARESVATGAPSRLTAAVRSAIGMATLS